MVSGPKDKSRQQEVTKAPNILIVSFREVIVRKKGVDCNLKKFWRPSAKALYLRQEKEISPEA